jgi:predicted RNA-binding protein associated with RNAse of E/G family
VLLKRKYGDRSDWKRLLEREYAQSYVESDNFKGYLSLLKIGKVKEPLYVTYNDQDVCVVNDGFLWLQQFPLNKHHSVTTMFDEKGQIVQWYIDICYMNGVSEENVPWMDDLFLDIVVLPSGEVIQKDSEELDEALLNGTIEKSLYNLAIQEANLINSLIKEERFTLLQLSEEHKDILLQMLQK